METKEKKRLKIEEEYKSLFEPKGQSIKDISRFLGQSTFWKCWKCLMMSSGVQVNFLNDSYRNRHEDCLNMSCCGHFSEIYIKSSNYNLWGFNKRGSF